MSELGYQMIWFIATALMIITVLAVGTLKAAGLFAGRRENMQDESAAVRQAEPAATPTRTRAPSAPTASAGGKSAQRRSPSVDI